MQIEFKKYFTSHWYSYNSATSCSRWDTHKTTSTEGLGTEIWQLSEQVQTLIFGVAGRVFLAFDSDNIRPHKLPQLADCFSSPLLKPHRGGIDWYKQNQVKLVSGI